MKRMSLTRREALGLGLSALALPAIGTAASAPLVEVWKSPT